MSSLGFGDGVGGITFGKGIVASDMYGLPLTSYDGTQRVYISVTPATSSTYAQGQFSGNYNDLTNKPVLLQGVPGQSIVGAQGIQGVAGKDGLNATGSALVGVPGAVVYLSSTGVETASSTISISSNVISGDGGGLSNLQSTNITPFTTLNVSGSFHAGAVAGDGGGLSNIQGSNVNGTVNTANYVVQHAQSNILTLGYLTSLGVQGSLGVGTATPSAKLEVVGATRTTSLDVTSNITCLNLACSNLASFGSMYVNLNGSCSLQTMFALSANVSTFVKCASTIIKGLSADSTISNLSSFPNNGSGSTRDALVISQNTGSTARFKLWGDVYNVGAQIDACAQVFRWMPAGSNPTTEFMRLSGDGLTLNGRLNVLDTNNNDGAAHIIGCSALTNGTSTGIAIGKQQSSYNSGVIMYYHTADGSNLNTLNLGIYGINNQILTVAPNSCVGIGQTNPVFRLDVSGNVRATQTMIVGSSNVFTPSGAVHVRCDTAGMSGSYVTESMVSGIDASIILKYNSVSYGFFGYANTLNLTYIRNNLKNMITYSSGNGASLNLQPVSGSVGIGNSAPSATLDVTGSLKVSGNANFGGASQDFPLVIAGNQTLYSASMPTSAFAGDPGNAQLVICNATDPTYRAGFCVDSTVGRQGTYIQSVRQGTGVLPLVLNGAGGNIGINTGATAPGCPLSFGTPIQNKILTLYDGNNTEAVSSATNFFGFGINNNVLRYQTGTDTSQHIFYQGGTVAFALSKNYALINGSTYISANLAPAGEYYSPTPALHLRAGNATNETGILFECAGYSTSMIGAQSGRNGLTYSVQSGAGHYFKVGATYNSNLLTTGTEALTILGNGNVGIGETNPTHFLQFGQPSDPNPQALFIPATSYAGSSRARMNLGAWEIGQDVAINGNKDLYFYTGSGVAMDINANGYVGFGTTSPAYKVDVAGGCRVQTLKITSQPMWNLGWVASGVINSTIIGRWTYNSIGAFMQGGISASPNSIPFSYLYISITGYYELSWNAGNYFTTFLVDSFGTRLTAFNVASSLTCIVFLTVGQLVGISYQGAQNASYTADSGWWCGKMVG